MIEVSFEIHDIAISFNHRYPRDMKRPWIAAAVAVWMIVFWAGCAADGHRATNAPGEQTDERATEGPEEHWYRLDVDGIPAGWMLSREIVRDDQRTTVSRLHLRFKRADSSQVFASDSRFVETLDGRPLNAWSRQTLGQKPIETTWTFLAHEVLVDVTHGDASRQQRVALPTDSWLTPGQIQPRLRRLLADGDRQFTLSTLDPQLGLEIIDTEWMLDAEDEQMLIDGDIVSTRRFRQRQSVTPQLESLVNITAEGLTVRSATPMMGFTVTSTLARREEAIDSGDGPELMARTFIYPDRSIANPRQARKIRYEIVAKGSMPLGSLPSVGAQKVLKRSARSSEGAEETIHLLVDVGSSPISGETRGDLEPYLRASTFIDHQSDDVRRLLTDALAAGPSTELDAQRAETLRAFVADYLLDKNLDSMLATAGEVAASRSGDCTEHSVLLTALLRAAGIPARAVTGLVYVEEFAGERDLFGYHMWTQAWIGDRWIDLDATLPVTFDAAHIAFGTSALNDDHSTLKELAQLATFIGQASIRVLEVDYRPDP